MVEDLVQTIQARLKLQGKATMAGTSRTANHPKGPGERASEALLYSAAILAVGLWLGWYYDWPILGECLDLAGGYLYPRYLSALPEGMPGILRDSRVFMALVGLAFALCIYLIGTLLWFERLRRWYEDQDEQRRRRTAARLQEARDRVDRRNRPSNRAQ
jgi:hypothetical protein